jgi:hypothetical protein
MFLHLFTATVFCHVVLASKHVHFQQWYPQFEKGFESIIRTKCNEEFERYMTETPQPGCKNCIAGPVVTCMLEALDENVKAMFASAGVLLALLPTTLSLAGPSTIETGILAQRRPFLAFLLALCSPAASPIRTIDYRDPQELLRRKPDIYRIKADGISVAARRVISGLEYLLTTAAIANVAHVTWELSVKTVTAVSTVTEFLPALWVATSVIIHILGAWAVRLRTSILLVEHATRSESLFIQEWMLSAVQPQATLQLKPEELLFIFISWLVSTGIILHIVFGTLVLAGTLFITPQDALCVVARYLASTILCKTVLMYEIVGMRETVTVESEQEPLKGQIYEK